MKRSVNLSRKLLMLSIAIMGVVVSVHRLAKRASAEPKSDKKQPPAQLNKVGANAEATFNNAADLVVQGQKIFWFDSFGDEKFWET
jgi:hypothetical protein